LNNNRVKNYFSDIATEFDNHYDNSGSAISRMLDKLLRKGMYERAAETMAQCGNVTDKEILDIGCGSGRQALELARKGAEVTGVDFSAEMIELARNYRRQRQITTARFLCRDFMTYAPYPSFDITIALGVTDYVANPMLLLKKMLSMTTEQMFVSFPAKFSPLALPRKIWLTMRNCPVHFYSRKRLIGIYSSLGIKDYTIISLPVDARIPTDYLVTVKQGRKK